MRGKKLREIVGGSALIESMFGHDDQVDERETLVQQAKKVIFGSRENDVKIVYCAAGGATMTFANDPEGSLLDQWISQWPLWVAENLPGLQLAQAWVKSDIVNRDFKGSVVKALAARLEVAKHQATLDLPRANPVLDLGIRGGVAVDTADFGGSGKQFADLTSLRQSEAAHGTLGDRLKIRFFSEDSQNFKLPYDHEQISGEGYLAVVHIDGNRVGRLLSKFGSDLDRFAVFSRALSESTRRAVQEASDRALLEDENENALGRPIVVGGDDVTAVMRADKAIYFTARFIKTFEEETRARLGDMPELKEALGEARCLTASAGIAFIRRNHPFSDGYHLAEALCKRAKRAWANSKPTRAHELAEGLGPSMVAFQRVTSSLADLDWPKIDGLKYRVGPYYLSNYAYTEFAEDRKFPCLNTLEYLVDALQRPEVSNSRLRGLIDLVSEARTETLDSLQSFSPARAQAEWERICQIQEERESHDDPFWTGNLLEELKNLITQSPNEKTWRDTPWTKVWRDLSAEGDWCDYGSPWVDAYDLVGAGAVTSETLKQRQSQGV